MTQRPEAEAKPEGGSGTTRHPGWPVRGMPLNAVAIAGGIVGEGAPRRPSRPRDDRVTHGDILALAAAGTASGVLAEGEEQMIANVFELDTRTVESAMTTRDRIVHCLWDDPPEMIRARITSNPHSTDLVCAGDVDRVVGYVDAKDEPNRVLNNQSTELGAEGLLHKVLVFRPAHAVGGAVPVPRREGRGGHERVQPAGGVITLNDVMSTVMGDLVGPRSRSCGATSARG